MEGDVKETAGAGEEARGGGEEGRDAGSSCSKPSMVKLWRGASDV